MRFIASIVLLTLLGAIAYGSLYSWVDTNRPPVSLSDALRHADRLLGDDRERYYCINAHIYGNESGDGKEGAWNLMFGTRDGSRKHVYVNMQGESRIKDWNGPVDWTANKGRRLGLADARARILAVLESQSLKPDFDTTDDDAFTISRSTREFSLHTLDGDGEYSLTTKPVVGPCASGIWIYARRVNTQPPDQPYRWLGPYWRLHQQNYILGDGNGFLVVEIRYGAEFPSKVVDQITQCFGDQVP